MAEEKNCSNTIGGRCTRPARMAIATSQPRGGLVTRVYYDVSEAPAKTTTPLCKEHGGKAVAAFIRDVVQED